MTTQHFADQFRLHTRLDECGDKIIPGKRGHLYVDGGEVCAMWTDAPAMLESTLAKLGGRFWQGDIGRGANGRRVQDAWVRGIQPEAYKLAIRLVGAKSRRVMSPAQRAVLEKARMANPLFANRTVRDAEVA